MSKRDVSSTVQELRFTISCRNIEEIMLMEDDYVHLLSNMSCKINGGYFVCVFFFLGKERSLSDMITIRQKKTLIFFKWPNGLLRKKKSGLHSDHP